MYHGKVMPNRGIEMLICLVSINPNVAAIILGDGEEIYVRKLKQLAKEICVAERVCFYGAIPQNELWKYVGAADVGMILAPAVSKNHLYSLPNKFFENIQSETPIICPAYPAMRQITEYYRNGMTCDPYSPSEINNCIDLLRTKPELYQCYKKNTREAKKDLCWEREKNRLRQAYKKLIG